MAAGAISTDVISTSLNGVVAEEALVDWGEGVRNARVCGCFPFRDAMTALRASSSRRRCCSMSSRLGLPEAGIVEATDVEPDGASAGLSARLTGCSSMRDIELAASGCSVGLWDSKSDSRNSGEYCGIPAVSKPTGSLNLSSVNVK